MRRIISKAYAAIGLLGLLSLPAAATAGPTNPQPSPSSGTLSTSKTTLSYSAGAFLVDNDTSTAGNQPICGTPATPCSDYTLHVDLPSTYQANHPNSVIKIRVAWPTTADDFDVYVLDQNGKLVGSSASSADPESISIPAGSGSRTLTVRVAPYTVTGDSYKGTVALSSPPPAPAQATFPAPRYINYQSPKNLGNDSGEPSIGSNYKSGNVMFQAVLQTLRVNFNDRTSPARDTWKDVSAPLTSIETLDPILFTDHQTGRTFVSQLTGQDSLSEFTDNDGASYTPSQGGGIPSGVDHQTLGDGNYAPVPVAGRPDNPVYPEAVYYCSQDIATAFCARSDDGGLTFGPGVPIYTLEQCGGLHGHVKVGPQGTVYVPNGSCGSNQGVAVSEDNGETWQVRTDPESTPDSGSDPSVGISTRSTASGVQSQGTVYLGYEASNNHARIAVSHDHGRTWEHDQDVGAALGIKNIVFPAVVAGDDDRAAFAFLGSKVAGDHSAGDFKGIWHLYIATTLDGGQTWETVDATPNDPVQRAGGICTNGTTCSGNNRNLLDFIGATVDKVGRVLVGYADGCINSCVQSGPNSFSAKATIARQSGGPRLFSKFDPAEPAAPKAPLLDSALQQPNGDISVDWEKPDNGGAPITGYNIYRARQRGEEQVIAETSNTKTTYKDTTAKPDTTYYYRVSAVNKEGQGPASNEVKSKAAPVPADPCKLPGFGLLSDPAGDQTGAPANKQVDIRALSVAEPYFRNATDRLVFSLDVDNLDILPPNAEWNVIFDAPNGNTYFVDMNTNNNGQPAYEYGAIDSGTGGTQTFNTKGTIDPRSGYSKDGRIVLVVADSKIGDLQPGNTISGVNATTQILVGAAGTGLLETADDTGKASYTLKGNAFCRPNTAPIASLSASPQKGHAPLDVQFDASASHDADKGDHIANYTFNFGDGSGRLTQSSPTTSHTYEQAGDYRATLTVKDNRGKRSSNKGTVVIEAKGNKHKGHKHK